MKYLLLMIFMFTVNCATTEATKTEKVTFIDNYWPEKEPCNKDTQITRHGKCQMAPKDLINLKKSNQRCKDKRKGVNRCVKQVYINERCHVHVLCGEAK